MNEGPSKYGGIAAVMVLGVGMLLVGKISAGIAILGLGGLAMALVLPSGVGAKAFCVGIAALVVSGVFAYNAATNEITGTATYHTHRHKGDPGEPVTRSAEPEKFRSATNLLWGVSGFCLVVSGIGFTFYRKLDDCV